MFDRRSQSCMILRRVCVAFVMLSMPSLCWSQSGSTRLIDYLSAQTEAASRLLALTRPLCPNQTFGDFEALVKLTDASVAWSQLTAEATRNAINKTAALQLEGHFEQALEVICEAVRQRAEAGGVLDLRTFAVLNSLALLLRQNGRVAEARALLEEMLPIARQYPTAAAKRRRTIQNNLATALVMQGHLKQAEFLYRDCIESAESLDQIDAHQMGVDLSNLAKVLDLQGELKEAESWHRRALALRTDAFGMGSVRTAASLMQLGDNLTLQHKYAEGEKALRRGLEIFTRQMGDRHLNTSFMLDGLAQNLLQQGRASEARPLGERSVSIRLDILGPVSPYTANSYFLLSRIELALGHSDAALRYARAALSGRLPISRREGTALNTTGQAYIRQSVASAAFQVVTAAWHELGRRDRQGVKAQELREEAFLAMQRISRFNTGDAFSLASARKLASRSGLATLVGDLEVREERLRWLDTALAEAASVSRTDTQAFSALKAEQAKLGGEIRALNGQLRSKFPDYFEQVREEPLSLGELRSAHGGKPLIGANEVLVVMTPGSGTERGYVWAVSRERMVWAQLRIGADTLERAIVHLLRQMEIAGRGVKLDASVSESRLGFDRHAAFDLYGQLFGDPRIQEVVRSKQQWIIVAQGALLATPFNALVVAAPAEGSTENHDPAALRATRWLGLERTLSFLPSVSNLSTLRRRRKVSAPASLAAGSLFAMGDPVFVPSAGGDPSLAEIHKLPRLPGTRAEIDMLTRILPAHPDDVLLDVDATEAELKKRSQSSSLGRAKVVVFATHALPAVSLSSTVQEPALVLTQPQHPSAMDDGLLTASEAAQLRFDADWIVLSACNTAGSATAEGDGLSGLARAFLFAGGQALLVSQWRLDDDSAPLLTSGTLAAAAGPMSLSRAESLRASMRALMSDAAYDGTWLTRAHPAVWAPMILVGVD